MRKVILLAGLLSALTIGVSADDVEMDMDLMQNIEDTNKSLSSNIALQRADASTSDANDLSSMFGIVENHFIKKGDAENAVELATKSRNLAQDIIKSVSAKDFDTANNSATELSRACRSCHTFYKKE